MLGFYLPERVMGITSVIIENWPKSNQWVTLYVPLFISLSSLAVAIRSLLISRKEIILAHRPFIFMVQPQQIPTTNDYFFVRCINAPARILVVVRYFGINVNGDEQLVHEAPDQNESIIFPTASPSDNTIHNVPFALGNLSQFPRFRRIVRISYSELNSKRKYYFESNMRFRLRGLALEFEDKKENAN